MSTTTTEPPQIARLVSKGLRSQVARALREAIFNGVLKPGDQVQEIAIAAQMGVSRSPLREALLVLEREGLVVIKANRGAFIRTITSEEAEEILSLRVPLESMALRLAKERVTPDVLHQLHKCLGRMCELAQNGDIRGLIEEEFVFHKSIWAASGNKLLSQTLIRLCTPWFAFAEMIHSPSKLSFSENAESHRLLIDYLAGQTEFSAIECQMRHFSVMKPPLSEGLVGDFDGSAAK